MEPPPEDIPIRGRRSGVAPWVAEGEIVLSPLKHPLVAHLGTRNEARGSVPEPAVLEW